MHLSRGAWLKLLLLLEQLVGLTNGEPTFNRTEGLAEVGSCEGLKSKVELGLDISIVVNSDLLCAETISLLPDQDVTISGSVNQQYVVAIAEDFPVPNPASS
ncbi:unnamed protein product, partial [Sphacelaria rigidula]